jgi:hypothetical protein
MLKDTDLSINEAIETYGFTPSAAALHVINLAKDYNKRGRLKNELSSLYLQKYALDQAYSYQSQVLISLAELKGYGLTEDRILQLNDFLESNGYKASSYTSVK